VDGSDGQVGHGHCPDVGVVLALAGNGALAWACGTGFETSRHTWKISSDLFRHVATISKLPMPGC
jgi:hypothetical protein